MADIYEPQGIAFLDAYGTFITNELLPLVDKTVADKKVAKTRKLCLYLLKKSFFTLTSFFCFKDHIAHKHCYKTTKQNKIHAPKALHNCIVLFCPIESLHFVY